MAQEPLKLLWKDQLIGYVTDARWSDYPWACGKLSIVNMPPNLREVMEYLHKESMTEDGVTDWPFSDEYVRDWRMVKPDGKSDEISQPIIDFGNGHIEWR